MSEIPIEKNAVLGDDELQTGLRSINSKWGGSECAAWSEQTQLGLGD